MASKIKILAKSFEDEDNLNNSLSVENTKDETVSEVSTNSNVATEGAIIEITDSQSPKNNVDDSFDDTSTNRRVTRRSTRRGRGQRTMLQNTKYVTHVTKSPVKKGRRNSRRNSFDKELEILEQAASTLKTVKHNTLPVSDESPVLIESDNDCNESEEVVNVKVVWRHGEPHSFPIMKKKDLGSIYEFFAKRENVSIQNILLSKNETVLSPHSTPLSIEYKVTDILEGGVLHDADNKRPKTDQQDKTCIEVKIQQKNVKKPLLIQLHKSNNMHILAKKVASELGIDVIKLRFNFDGDALDLEETVESLDLDGGECFDLVIIS